MNENNIEDILNNKPVFKNRFCNNRFKKNDTCFKFYYKNRGKKDYDILVCPFGYSCIFCNNIIISSILDSHSNIPLINRRNFYSKRNKQVPEEIQIISDADIDNIIYEIKYKNEINYYRDTFHDLNNNNRYLKDCYDNLVLNNDDADTEIKNKIKDLSDIFLLHKKKMDSSLKDIDKYYIYKNELESIDKITQDLLNVVKTENNTYRDLKSNLEFIDFRIRYLKRLIDGRDVHHSQYLKSLYIGKILTKLKYAFDSTIKKKDQKIVIIKKNNSDFNVQSYDDIFLGFFILFENAAKYAPFNTVINVKIEEIDNSINIEIENDCDSDVGPVDELLMRGKQGLNHKDGNGLGLSIAKDIFKASNFDFLVKYQESKFKCIITKVNIFTDFKVDNRIRD